MAKKNEALRLACRNLRLTERLTTFDIAKRMNASSANVRNWVRDIPLSQEERSAVSVNNARKASARLRDSCADRGITDELRAECIRLHREEYWPLSRIADEKGLSKGTISYWLKGLPPLTPLERSRILSNSRAQNPRVSRRVAVRPPLVETDDDMSELDRTTRGGLSELAIQLLLTRKGWTTARPLFECGSRYDLLVGLPESNFFARLQIKTIRWPQNDYGHPTLTLRARSGKGMRTYLPTDFDLLVGFCLETDTTYVLNWADIGSKTTGISINPRDANAWHKLEVLFPSKLLPVSAQATLSVA